MTLSLEAPAAHPASLTTSQLQALLHLWRAAGWPPACGYEAVGLAVAVASDPPLVTALTAVDFDDVRSVTAAREALLDWRHRRLPSSRGVSALAQE